MGSSLWRRTLRSAAKKGDQNQDKAAPPQELSLGLLKLFSPKWLTAFSVHLFGREPDVTERP